MASARQHSPVDKDQLWKQQSPRRRHLESRRASQCEKFITILM